MNMSPVTLTMRHSAALCSLKNSACTVGQHNNIIEKQLKKTTVTRKLQIFKDFGIGQPKKM